MSTLLLSIVFSVAINCCQLLIEVRGESSDWTDASIQVVLLVHPYNKIHSLPFSLASIERQTHDKQRIKVYIRTESVNYGKHEALNHWDEERLAFNALTIDILKKWTQTNRHVYNDIELQVGDRYLEDYASDGASKYWSTARFEHIIQQKSKSMQMSVSNWADFVLFMDCDVILTNEHTFSEMTSNERLIAIAPMLYSLGTYSNFWAGMTPTGYYKRTQQYIPILERQTVGQFVVPMIHSCVFINMRYKKAIHLTFDSRNMKDVPFDDIIAFAKSANNSNISLYIDNREIWGYIPPPIDSDVNLKSLEDDVIDLELESLVEGSKFPVSPSLFAFMKRPKADKLNVDHIYLINLVRRTDRLKRMLNCFEVLGIEAQIWKAIDGKELSEQILQSRDIHVMKDYADPYHKRPMTYGEIGCFLSHYAIWEDIVLNNYSKVIVFEDDVRFERLFKNKLNKAVQSLNTNVYDFMYLGRKIQGDPKNESHINDLFVEPTYSYWTIGYLITKRGAQKLLDVDPLKSLIPVDEFLPIMFDRHTNDEWKQHFPKRDLKALSLDPLLIYPTHYVGDSLYISDTEDSEKLIDNLTKEAHPKHTEF